MFIDTQGFAELILVSPRTLEQWRVAGCGPAFLKAGRRVLYDPTDVQAWLDRSRRHSTSETPQWSGVPVKRGEDV